MVFITMATTLRSIALTKIPVHKKCPFMLGSAWCSSAAQNKNNWSVHYKYDGREDRSNNKDAYKDPARKDHFLLMTLFLQRDVDLSLSGIKLMWKHLKADADAYGQRYIAQRVEVLGHELAAAHFLVYRGGAVKLYGHPKWIRSSNKKQYDVDLPRKFVSGVVVEAIDASDVNLLFEALIHFESLQRLKWASFRNNVNVDDWFLDRLAFCKDSLEYLDISGCTNITERGAMSLSRFRFLKVLKLGNLQGVKHIQLLKLLLEEVLPNCKIEGVESEIDFLSSGALPEDLKLDQPAKADMVNSK